MSLLRRKFRLLKQWIAVPRRSCEARAWSRLASTEQPVVPAWLVALWCWVKRDRRALCDRCHRASWEVDPRSRAVVYEGALWRFLRCGRCSMLWFSRESLR
jgi:hypothetical protein